MKPSLSYQFSVHYKPEKEEEGKLAPALPMDSGLISASYGQRQEFQKSNLIRLRNMGVPVSQIICDDPSMIKVFVSDKIPSKRKVDDLIAYADSFAMAKWIIKMNAYESNIDVSFIPVSPCGKENFFSLDAPELL